jgi:ElaB/YqjD/DUF883 family membrane-anchored ribosome-binding protein
MATRTQARNEKLMQDLKLAIAEVEELMHAGADQAGEKAESARERIQEILQTARSRLADAEQAVIDRAERATAATDNYVHENPWAAIGMATGVGLLLGMLITRR